ncbi:MAG: hypothetical protein ABIV13_01460 [Fimbriimonadales bacterium]
MLALAYGCFWTYTQDIPIVTKAGVIMAALGIAGAIILSKYRMVSLASFGYFVLLISLILAITIPLRMGLEAVPYIASNLTNTSYQAGNLRMPFFAAILVIIMLSRPQGVFGHREFSWSFLSRKKSPQVPA